VSEVEYTNDWISNFPEPSIPKYYYKLHYGIKHNGSIQDYVRQIEFTIHWASINGQKRFNEYGPVYVPEKFNKEIQAGLRELGYKVIVKRSCEDKDTEDYHWFEFNVIWK